MPESIEIEQNDDLYWSQGSDFVQVMVMELNEALKANGIEDAGQREKICTHFAFGMGNFLDQYWMESEGQKFYPLLCFSHEFLNIGMTPAEIGPVLVPSRDFEFHGAGGDIAAGFFNQQGEELAGVRIGYIGEE